MLQRFILLAMLYVPVYIASASFIYVNAPDYIPEWLFIFLPLIPLFLFFWWIIHRDEGL